jgi:hypothetical protein
VVTGLPDQTGHRQCWANSNHQSSWPGLSRPSTIFSGVRHGPGGRSLLVTGEDHISGFVMDPILDCREEIYDYFQANAACQKYFFTRSNEEEYVAYYNSMYLLQETRLTVWRCTESGVSRLIHTWLTWSFGASCKE